MGKPNPSWRLVDRTSIKTVETLDTRLYIIERAASIVRDDKTYYINLLPLSGIYEFHYDEGVLETVKPGSRIIGLTNYIVSTSNYTPLSTSLLVPEPLHREVNGFIRILPFDRSNPDIGVELVLVSRG